MVGNLAKNWPAYVAIAGVIWFFIYVLIKGNLPERKDNDEQNTQDKPKVSKNREKQ